MLTVAKTEGRRRSASWIIAAATIGNALEFYDFITYSFFAIQIGRTFFPSHDPYVSLMSSLGTFFIGFIARPIGGIVIGSYADRAGRRAAMMLSFTMMGCAIIGISLIPSYNTIGIAAPILAILARLVQGFSLGGEVGPNTAYLMEAAPLYRRGFFVSWQGASQGIAATAGGVVGVVLAATMSAHALDAYGWRIAFLLGALTLPFGLVLRYSIPETLHEPEKNAQAAPEASRFDVFWRNRKILLIGLAVIMGGTINTYVSDYMTTFAQDTLHMNTVVAFGATVANNAVTIAASLFAGWLSDRIGRRPVMLLPSIAYLVLIYPIFLWIVDSRSAFALLGGSAILALGQTIGFSAFFAGLTESIPKQVRGAGIGAVYATAVALFGGTAQPIVKWLIHATGNSMAPAWYTLAATAVGICAMTMMHESAPASLARLEAPALVEA